jgi:hypothetical protein
MRNILPSAPFRLTGVSLVVIGLVVLACAEVNKPAGPSSTSYPTITITANGISNEGPYLIPGMPVKVVNADSVVHRLHPNLNEPPGCASIDSGDIAPGESQLTPLVGSDVTSCSVHDHMNHGDPRFQIKLSVDPGQ